jgi:serine protease AprX
MFRMCAWLTLLILIFPVESAGHEPHRYWVFFSDTERTARYAEDATPDAVHIAAVRAVTDSVTVVSRWLNAVSVPAAPEQISRITALPFVASVQPVARMSRPRPIEKRGAGDASPQTKPVAGDTFYGRSSTQIRLHGIDKLHERGITGSGVVLGFLDTGYRWNQHPALLHADVVGERDFVAEHYTGDWLPDSHYDHGTLVFSVVAGYEPGTFIGVAHSASFLLGATEDVRTETPIEEDFWVAGIEWMADAGADIVSTSLGYSTFDEPYESYVPEDMDGRTAVTTIAAERAFEEGLLVVASAGNAGNSPWRIITAPADGEHVIAVGAMTGAETIASFSSRGPSADGRIKPDVTALGVGVDAVLPGSDGYSSFQGTSLSAPIVSGALALVLSARPDLSAAELLNAVRMSARPSGQADNTFGFGLLDAVALLAHPVYRPDAGPGSEIQTFLISPSGFLAESAHIYIRPDAGGPYTQHPVWLAAPIQGSSSGAYESRIDGLPAAGGMHFVIAVQDSAGIVHRYPQSPRHEYFLPPDGDLIAVVERTLPEQLTLFQNYPNPFNGSTNIRFDLPDDAHVTVRVYDLLGRRIATLADGFHLAGTHEVSWRPDVQASGVYFYRVGLDGGGVSGRMMYIR